MFAVVLRITAPLLLHDLDKRGRFSRPFMPFRRASTPEGHLIQTEDHSCFCAKRTSSIGVFK